MHVKNDEQHNKSWRYASSHVMRHVYYTTCCLPCATTAKYKHLNFVGQPCVPSAVAP